MAATIRRAVPGEEKAVAKLLLRLVEQHVEYDRERFSNFVTIDGAAAFYRTRIESDSAAVLVAEIENNIKGFAYLEFEEISYEELLERCVWLHDIYLEPDSRSSGSGAALLRAAASAARELGGEKMLLSVAARNKNAQAFFRKAGFRPTMIEMTLNFGDLELDD